MYGIHVNISSDMRNSGVLVRRKMIGVITRIIPGRCFFQ
jgi:hypothetical protein